MCNRAAKQKYVLSHSSEYTEASATIYENNFNTFYLYDNQKLMMVSIFGY